ncbi:succinate dehydrogenase / fumarate reductase, flavoprotein subunit [Geobacteraceae bacterium]|nr:succinate dehydrogenase / fumarate reductase, flavoprotein subunit [Geobacteraceae bacterium]
MEHKFDIIIVGAGGGGLFAALEAVRTNPQVSIAVVSKLYPTRSHTSAAQGGVNAALANKDRDDTVELHVFDTVKGSDYLADQDAVDYLCSQAPEVVRELENLGAPFSRFPDGTIAQRPFGGTVKDRCCYCADKTGHTLLHTLFEQCLRRGVKFFNEYFLLSLEHADGECQGIVAMNMRTSAIEAFSAKIVILATGGHAKMYWNRSSNAAGNTGDGQAAALRAGIPLKDMEFIQFHPTGLRKSGLLVTEGARGEGGYLLNRHGERFMARYAPQKMELGPRDLVARSMETEILEGNALTSDAGSYLELDLRHLGAEAIKKKLPQIRELSMHFEGIDPIEEPIPVRPTAHYSMGGIDANMARTAVSGIYAVGECACVSVHGANRLGGNSLLDILVFGKRAGQEAALEAPRRPLRRVAPSALWKAADELKSYTSHERYERYGIIREEMGKTMADKVGIYRTEERLRQGVEEIRALRERFRHIRLFDTGTVYNTNLVQILELKNMLDLALCVAETALVRQESRGSHYREDFPRRDDEAWHRHSLCTLEKGGDVRLAHKPVTMGKYSLETRSY